MTQNPDTGRRALLGAAAIMPLLTASSSPGAPPPSVGTGRIAGLIAVTDHGAVGDGIADDHAAITRAIAAARAQGGGTVILPHAGPWRVSAPIEIADDVTLTGTVQHTVVKRTGGDGDAVITGRDKARFRIANLTLIGTRPPGGRGAGGSACDGIALQGCSYFDIDTVRADYCRHGFRFRECFTFGVAQATALRCASYGFALSDGCTSFVLRNTTSWGCGGGWSIAGCAYGSLTGCACDLSDAGGKPGDPFGDSGGDYRRPAFIFDLSGSKGIAIIAPGCENCNSPWLYAEGTQATILSPFIFGMEAHTPDWRLIQLRGADSYSNVTIVNPFGFDAVANPAGAGTAILIENPQRQRLFLSGRWRVNAFDGERAYPSKGLVVEGQQTLLDYTAVTMTPGGTRLLSPHPDDRASVTVEGLRKSLHLVRGGTGLFQLPVPAEGLFHLVAQGRCSMPGGATFSVLPRPGAPPARRWQETGSGIAIDEWFYLPPGGSQTGMLTIALQPGARVDLETLVMTCVEGQV